MINTSIPFEKCNCKRRLTELQTLPTPDSAYRNRNSCNTSKIHQPRERVCVLRLPREKQPRPNGDHTHRSFAWQPHERQPLPNGDHARRSSAWQLCVLRLPGERQPRPNGDDARCSSLCVPRLPRERQPRPNGDHAPQLLQEVLCTAPATREARRSSSRRLCVFRLPCREAAAAQRRPRAPQLLQEALCIAPATREARRSSSRRLCVLRLPREKQPAQRRPRAASPAWQLCVQRLPHTRQPQPFKSTS